MKKEIFSIRENVPIADGVYRMRLAGDTSEITAPGQFVNIKLDRLYLRRPISVCDIDAGELCLVYKAVGRGTEQMSRMGEGELLDILTGLGNGYSTDAAGESPLLVGGGVGDCRGGQGSNPDREQQSVAVLHQGNGGGLDDHAKEHQL